MLLSHIVQMSALAVKVGSLSGIGTVSGDLPLVNERQRVLLLPMNVILNTMKLICQDQSALRR